MPNWVNATITVKGTAKQIADLRAGVSNDDRKLDFDRIIPMPEALAIESGSTGEIGLAYFIVHPEEQDIFTEEEMNTLVKKHVFGPYLRDADAAKAKEKELGLQYLRNIRDYGAPTWYEWCCNNWGTKWNACSVYSDWKEEEALLVFDTAWSFPTPIILAISEQYGVRVEAVWEEEQRTYDFGYMAVENGEIIKYASKDNFYCKRVFTPYTLDGIIECLWSIIQYKGKPWEAESLVNEEVGEGIQQGDEEAIEKDKQWRIDFDAFKMTLRYPENRECAEGLRDLLGEKRYEELLGA